MISQRLLGTREVFVIAHSDCGMRTFTNQQLRQQLREAGADADDVDFAPFPDPADAVRESLRRIRESPLLPDDYGAHGFVFDNQNGQLEPVEA